MKKLISTCALAAMIVMCATAADSTNQTVQSTGTAKTNKPHKAKAQKDEVPECVKVFAYSVTDGGANASSLVSKWLTENSKRIRLTQKPEVQAYATTVGALDHIVVIVYHYVKLPENAEADERTK